MWTNVRTILVRMAELARIAKGATVVFVPRAMTGRTARTVRQFRKYLVKPRSLWWRVCSLAKSFNV